MTRIIDKVVTSKYHPRNKNVVWIDTSGSTPIQRHFINGEWVSLNDNTGKSGNQDTSKGNNSLILGNIKSVENASNSQIDECVDMLEAFDLDEFEVGTMFIRINSFNDIPLIIGISNGQNDDNISFAYLQNYEIFENLCIISYIDFVNDNIIHFLSTNDGFMLIQGKIANTEDPGGTGDDDPLK